jgi:hypothetical protein
MKTFDASLARERGAQPFSDQRYSRAAGCLDTDARGEVVLEGEA